MCNGSLLLVKWRLGGGVQFSATLQYENALRPLLRNIPRRTEGLSRDTHAIAILAILGELFPSSYCFARFGYEVWALPLRGVVEIILWDKGRIAHPFEGHFIINVIFGAIILSEGKAMN